MILEGPLLKCTCTKRCAPSDKEIWARGFFLVKKQLLIKLVFCFSFLSISSCTFFVVVVLFLLNSSELPSVLKNDESCGNSSPAVKINPGPGQPAEKTALPSCGGACLWQHFPEFPRAFKLLLQGPRWQVLSVCYFTVVMKPRAICP